MHRLFGSYISDLETGAEKDRRAFPVMGCFDKENGTGSVLIATGVLLRV